MLGTSAVFYNHLRCFLIFALAGYQRVATGDRTAARCRLNLRLGCVVLVRFARVIGNLYGCFLQKPAKYSQIQRFSDRPASNATFTGQFLVHLSMEFTPRHDNVEEVANVPAKIMKHKQFYIHGTLYAQQGYRRGNPS
jgi:hypothetical protein